MSHCFLYKTDEPSLWVLQARKLNHVFLGVLLMALLGVNKNTLAQTTGSFEISLPSPSAAGLGEFSHQEIDLAQGAPSYRIPLFEVSSKNLSVPIVLNYYSQGGRVDQPYNWTGVDWSVAAGGAIRRVVKGHPDESTYGYFETRDDYGDADLFERIGLRTIDSEPDKYSFSFLGYSGRFFLKLNNPAAVPSPSNIKVVSGGNNDLSFSVTEYSGEIKKFEAKDKQGNVYYFEVREVTSNRSQTVNNVTAWFLTKVENTNSDAEITIEYQSFSSNTPSHYEAQYYGADQAPAADWTGREFSNWSGITSTKAPRNIVSATDSIVFSKSDYLDTIKLFDRSSGVLRKSVALDYIEGTGDDRFTFISEVVHKDALGAVISTYTFEYYNINALSNAGDKEKDHWGYFNDNDETETLLPETVIGYDLDPYLTSNFTFKHEEFANRQPNPSTVYYGMLKKVILPTGGSIEYTYEPNEYHEVFKTFSPDLTEMQEITSNLSFSSISCPGGFSVCKKASFTVDSEKANGHVPIPSVADLNLVYSVFDGGSESQKVTLTNTTTSDYKGDVTYSGETGVVSVDLDDIMGDYLLENGTYELEFLATTAISPFVQEITTHEERQVTKKVGPGARVSSVLIHDGVDERTIHYEYNNSGVIISQPNYFFSMGDFNDDSPKPGDEYIYSPSYPRLHMGVLTSTSSSFADDSGNRMSGYREVTVVQGDSLNGWSTNYFSGIETPDPVTYAFGDPLTLKYLGAEYNSTAGKVLRTEVYNGSGKMLSKQTSSYYYHFLGSENENSFATQKGYSNYIFDSSNMKLFEYDDYIYWPELQQQRQVVYTTAGDSLETISDYEYDTQTKNITVQVETNSDGEERETLYEYAYEEYAGMAGLHMLSQPYSVSIKDGSGVLRSKRWTLWNTFGGNWHPCGVWVWTGGAATAPANCSSN